MHSDNLISNQNQKRYKRIKILLYSEDFDFAQSFSLFFKKDFQKIVTVNDKEVFLQIIKSIQPEIIVLDIQINESALRLINELRFLSSHSKVFIFSSHPFSQQEIVKQIQKQVDKIFFQPIDLVEFNQVLNFYTAD
jgi:DNA-binding response OmpR family regulator